MEDDEKGDEMVIDGPSGFENNEIVRYFKGRIILPQSEIGTTSQQRCDPSGFLTESKVHQFTSSSCIILDGKYKVVSSHFQEDSKDVCKCLL